MTKILKTNRLKITEGNTDGRIFYLKIDMLNLKKDKHAFLAEVLENVTNNRNNMFCIAFLLSGFW